MDARGYEVIVLSALVAGCAYSPNVTASYYFPKAETQILIAQSLACSSDSKRIVSATAVTPTTAYSSDFDPDANGNVRKGRLRYADLDGPLSDADTSLSFTDDGRLAGVNSSSTGEGSTIVKNTITLATAIAPLVAAAPAGKPAPEQTVPTACAAIQKWSASKPPSGAGDDTAKSSPTLTLTYTLSFLYFEGSDGRLYIKPDPAISQNCQSLTPKTKLQICPDANSRAAHDDLTKSYPNLNFTVEIGRYTRPLDQEQYADGATSYSSGQFLDAVGLDLNRVAMAALKVRGPGGDLSTVNDNDVWRGEYPVPLNEIYQLPIPKAAIFGKQQFTLTLSSYGSVTKLEYGKTSGLPDVTDFAGALAKALQKPSPEAQAAVLEGQSDLIYQTQRLAICQAEPKNCSSK